MGTTENLAPAADASRSFFDLEFEQIFKKEWLCVGRLPQVPNDGDCYTVDLLDDPPVVVRGRDRVRVLFRCVCTDGSRLRQVLETRNSSPVRCTAGPRTIQGGRN